MHICTFAAYGVCVIGDVCGLWACLYDLWCVCMTIYLCELYGHILYGWWYV